MAIVTISRGTHSGGKALAERLAAKLSYRLFDRETILGAASPCAELEEQIRQAFDRPPGLRDRLREDRRRYLAIFQACLTGAVREGRAIYVGNAGHLLIRDVSHVVRIRIVAPLEARVRTVTAAMGSSAEDALRYVRERDRLRARWTRFLYDLDWGDPLLYDAVLNLERLTAEDACDTVAGLVARPQFAETAASRAAMANLALGCAVKAALRLDPRTAALALQTRADGATVAIRGKVRNREQRAAVTSIATGVPGVERLDLEKLIRVLDA